MLNYLSALQFIFPSLLLGMGIAQNPQYHAYDVYTHCIHAFAISQPEIKSRLAALLHDAGKPAAYIENGNMHGHEIRGAEIARQELKALAFDNKTIDTVSLLIKNHMFDLQNLAKPLTVRKKIAELGEEMFRKLIALRRADFIGSGKPMAVVESAARWEKILEEMLAENAPFTENDLNITGNDIMQALNIPAGELVGVIKKRLLSVCIARPSQNSRRFLLAHAKNIYKELISHEQ